jgi:hypothetical protein
VAQTKTFSFSSILLLSFAPILLAQPNWDRVKQLAPGEELRVTLSGGHTVLCRFQSATDDAMMVAAGSVQETMGRPMIAKVSSKGQSHRGRHTLIGLGIGAGAGLTIGAVIDARSCSGKGWCLNFFPNAGKEVFTPLGAIVGTLVGVLTPSGSWREVYRSK